MRDRSSERTSHWPASIYLVLAAALAASLALVWRAGLSLRGVPGLPVLVVAGLFLAAGARRRWRARASVALLVVAAPFLAYESFLHLERPLPAHGAKAQRVRELRAAGVDAYPAVFPSGLAALATVRGADWLPRLNGEPVLPLAGVPHAVTVYCHGERGWIEYPSDRYGFRNPDAVWDAGAPLTVLLGDSFVQGFCVPEKDGLRALLAPPLGEVLALGANGTSVLVQYATFVEYAASLPLERVAWFYFEGNDRREYRSERNAPFWHDYLEGEGARGYAAAAAAIGEQLRRIVDEVLDDGELATVSHEIVLTPLRRAALWLSAGRTQLLVADRLRRLGWSDAGWSEEEIAQASRLWREVARRVAAGGGELLFVYLPSRERFEPATSGARLEALRREEAAVRGAWARQGVDSLSLAGALGTGEDALARFDGVHLDARGYRLAARRVLAAFGCSRPAGCR